MNVSRHVAKDMRSALAMVREQHGPDAVILSNKRVPEGIEITAAAGYDESILETSSPEPEKYTFPEINSSVPKQVEKQEDLAQSETKSLLRKPRFEYTPAPRDPYPNVQFEKIEPEQTKFEELDEELDFTVELSSAVESKQSSGKQLSAPLHAQKDAHENTTEKEQPQKSDPQKQDQNDLEKQASKKLNSDQTAEVVWTQDSLLDDMRQELHSLKSLVETQISGFAWGEMSRKAPVRAGVLRKLVALGLTPAVARDISNRIREDLGHRKAWYMALAMFARQIPIAGDTILTNGGVVALVGPAGVGKTTLIAKLAVQYATRHGRENVALITTDSQRFGAFDQLRNLGSVLQIPVRAVDSSGELDAALDGFMEKPLVLIDTAGLSYRDQKLAVELQSLKASTSMLKTYMVMSATTQADALEQMLTAFSPVNLSGCMITKVDESTSLGSVLSSVVEHKLPVAYYSEGQKIPDDLKIARVQDLVGKAVAVSKSMNAFDRNEDVMMEQMLKGEM
ncbi:MAG: flagellar biosynthesis protein FlhF [Gammaproteobacteria bacterium]